MLVPRRVGHFGEDSQGRMYSSLGLGSELARPERGGGLMISQWIRGRLGRRRDRTSTGPIHSRCGGVANTLESLFPRQSLPYFHRGAAGDTQHYSSPGH